MNTTIADLIRRVEGGEAGRDIDTDISRALDISAVICGGYEAGILRMNAWTRFIDCALPGENIVRVENVTNRFWRAFHDAPDGLTYQGVAPTEPAARRAARLREMLEE